MGGCGFLSEKQPDEGYEIQVNQKTMPATHLEMWVSFIVAIADR